ncbi:MAG: CopD family protein [Acidimicrobiia bacterium]
MLPITSHTWRLFLHVTAATVWVGGQLSLIAIMPKLRRYGVEPLRAAAQAFQRAAWPAFAVLVATGVWNLVAIHAGDRGTEWLTTLFVKLVFVAASGIAAAVHIFVAAPRVRNATTDAERKRAAAASGMLESVSLLFGLGAVFLGVMLRG